MKAKQPKWLYRMEAKEAQNGLWYNASGEFVFGIGELENCPTQELEMGYDERYQQGGKDWFSACTEASDLRHWYSVENAKDLLENGFVFTKYLAVDYVEYEKETVFLKETALDRVEITLEEVYKNEGSYMSEDHKKRLNQLNEECYELWGWEEGYTYEDASDFFMRMADSFQTLLQEIEVDSREKK